RHYKKCDLIHPILQFILELIILDFTIEYDAKKPATLNISTPFQEVEIVLLHIRSGEIYPVSFLALQPYDIENQMCDWENGFDWSIYFDQRGIEVYKIVIHGNAVIQGAIALEQKEDHVWVHLVESIPHKHK